MILALMGRGYGTELEQSTAVASVLVDLRPRRLRFKRHFPGCLRRKKQQLTFTYFLIMSRRYSHTLLLHLHFLPPVFCFF